MMVVKTTEMLLVGTKASKFIDMIVPIMVVKKTESLLTVVTAPIMVVRARDVGDGN